MPHLLAQLESSLSCLIVSALMILLTILLFTKLTKYNDWEEIAKGNLAAALALGGKVFGVANIMRFAITTNNNALDVILRYVSNKANTGGAYLCNLHPFPLSGAGLG